MRDGEGDSWFCELSSAGAILKGFAHESVMSPYAQDPRRVWPGVLESVPDVFAGRARDVCELRRVVLRDASGR
jgi:hypothetical protein